LHLQSNTHYRIFGSSVKELGFTPFRSPNKIVDIKYGAGLFSLRAGRIAAWSFEMYE
jgi:hypothetical protein